MKRPMAYRVDYSGEMRICPVDKIEFKQATISFCVGAWSFEQALDGSWCRPTGHTSNESQFVENPFWCFGSEKEAWEFQIIKLRNKRFSLAKNIEGVDNLISLAERNLAQASQNETKPPK